MPTSELLNLCADTVSDSSHAMTRLSGSGQDGDQLAGLGDSGFIPKKQQVGLESGPCVGLALPDVTSGSAQILLSPFLGSWE